jgi:hypothetical protein
VRRPPLPREAIANSISRTVRNSLKGQTDAVVERAILQARQEADSLYMLIVDSNVAVQQTIGQRNREFLFLLAYLEASMREPNFPDLEEQLRTLTLIFVNAVLLLERTISQISAERFQGQPILFSDSTVKLEEQLDMADQALEHFNFWAKLRKFQELSAEAICANLRPEIDKQVSCWVTIARGEMLAVFGEEGDLRASFDELIQFCS